MEATLSKGQSQSTLVKLTGQALTTHLGIVVNHVLVVPTCDPGIATLEILSLVALVVQQPKGVSDLFVSHRLDDEGG